MFCSAVDFIFNKSTFLTKINSSTSFEDVLNVPIYQTLVPRFLYEHPKLFACASSLLSLFNPLGLWTATDNMFNSLSLSARNLRSDSYFRTLSNFAVTQTLIFSAREHRRCMHNSNASCLSGKHLITKMLFTVGECPMRGWKGEGTRNPLPISSCCKFIRTHPTVLNMYTDRSSTVNKEYPGETLWEVTLWKLWLCTGFGWQECKCSWVFALSNLGVETRSPLGNARLEHRMIVTFLPLVSFTYPDTYV